MILQTHKTEQGWVAVSESLDIVPLDWCIMLDSFGKLFSQPQQYLGEEKGHYINKGTRKIIATDTSFKLPGIPQFEMKHREENIQQLSEEFADSKERRLCGAWSGLKQGFIEGYKTAKSKYQYTEEDMRKAFDFAHESLPILESHDDLLAKVVEYFKQPKELKAIEVGQVYEITSGGLDDLKEPVIKKSAEYPDGLLVVKNYIYE